MRLSEEISQVMSTWLPMELEMTHSYTVANPMITKSNGFGTALFHSTKSKFATNGVVIGDDSGFLGVAKVMESLAKFLTLLGIEEQGSIFGFSSGSTNGRDLLAQEVNGSIKSGGGHIRIAVIGDGAKGEKTCSTRSGTRFTIEGGIRMDSQLHVRGSIGNTGIWMTRRILKESLHLKHGALSGIGLLLG